MRRSFRLLRINREFLIFVVFLLVSVVFWFLQTFKEQTTAYIDYKLTITGVPKNVIFTSDVPEKVTVTVTGRGFAVLDYLTKKKERELVIDYSQLTHADGMLTIDNNVWKRVISRQIGNSLKYTSVNPSILEIYYSTGEHKYVPIVFGGKARVDAQHVLCDILINPSYVDVYAPDNQFDTVTTISTEAARFTGLKDTTIVRLALLPPKGVKCIPDSVDATICVDLFTTKTLKVPIYCENIPADKILRTFPLNATVTFRVSASMYQDISETDFAVVVDYKSITPDLKKCQLIVRTQPDGISNVQVSPQYVDYVIEQE